MTTASIARRTLRFDTLAEAVRDAETLLAKGYDKTGNWSLGQVCGHLANWMTYPIDGFPKVPLVIRPLLWMMKVMVGRRKLKTYLADRSFPAGAPTLPQSVPPATAEDAEGVAKLKAAADRFTAHTGPIIPSPLFGAMTKETAEQLQRVHCAHHLSFLVPAGPVPKG